MTHLFTNNAESLTASALTMSAGTSTVSVMSGEGDLFANPDVDGFQMLTIGAGDGPFEIVKMTARTGDVLTIKRRQESAHFQAWPSGTVISARITAGMLGDMVQSGPSPAEKSGAITPTSQAWARGSTAIGAGAVAEVENGWKIRGLPVIPHDHDLYDMGGMGNGGVEAVITSPFVDLGEPRTWAATTYVVDGEIVRPTTPNGYQYRVVVLSRLTTEAPSRLTTGAPAGSTQTDADEPIFGTTVGEFTASADGTHKFLCQKPSEGFALNLPGVFFPSEVGFICYTSDRSGITTKPSISVGTSGADGTITIMPTTQLTQIPSNNRLAAIHRESPTSDVAAQDLLLRLEVAAAGGRYVGRFFLRGLLIDARAV